MDFNSYFKVLCLLEVFLLAIQVYGMKNKGLYFKIDEESPANIDIGSIQQTSCGGSMEMVQGSTVNFHFVSENTQILSFIVINQSTGRITLRRPIDRDSMCEKMKLCCVELHQSSECIIQLKAVVQLLDNHKTPLTQKDCNVLIEITDINDHSPTFFSDKVVINISEAETIDSPHPLPMAHDPDSSKFSINRYYFHEASRFFRIECTQDNTGKIIPQLRVKSRLDREEISEHQLTVIASDAGVPPKTGSINVIIRILDENDNAPIIEQLSPISIKEDTLVDHHIIRIEAKDKDTGENELISFFLKEPNVQNDMNHFRIDQMSGVITLARQIDYDSIQSLPQIELIITVQDHGKPKQLSSTATLTIIVLDVNDEVPVISIIDLFSRQPARPEILENLQSNQLVAYVNVHDADHGLNGQVKCDLIGYEDDFSLENIEYNNVKDQFEYKIVTKVKLDCEKESLYRLIIRCSDSGHPKQTAQQELIVKVIDVNDNSPTFGRSRIELELSENEPPGTLLTTINVTDLDETDKENGRFDYTISESGRKLFRLEPVEGRGKLESAKLRIYSLTSFDREKISTIEFELTVSDTNRKSISGTWRSLSSSSTVIVHIKDRNDNAPIFSKTQYEFTITEEKPQNLFVGLLQATDEDQGDNGKISYKIDDFSSDVQNSFTLDFNTGTLTTKSKIDREKISIFEFKVKARDQGHPGRYSIANVVVKVSDINDNDPKFIYPTIENHTVSASIQSSENTLIMKVNALDYDEAGKNQITYSIEGGDPYGLFQIDSNVGGISFAKKPKPTDARSYFLLIKVTDNDHPSRSAQITIHVKVEESRQQYYNPDYKTGKENGQIEDSSWSEYSNNSKMVLNRNILLIICLIIISAALAGVLLMLIMCLKRRPSQTVRKSDLPESVSRKQMTANPNSYSIYFDSGKKPMFGTMKTNSNHDSNMSLNYRMVPAEKYQDLISDPNQGAYSGLAFYRKNTNLCGYNDQTINLINNNNNANNNSNNCENYNFSPEQLRTPKPGDNIYQKISANIELPTAKTRKPIIDDQILSTHDDAPSFLSSYGISEQESQPRALNSRYQTLNSTGKSKTINSATLDIVDNMYSDSNNATIDNVNVTPKKSFIASSFV